MAPTTERIVVVGASAGGVAALRALLAGIDTRFSWPIVIVLHIGDSNIEGLIEVLQATSRLPVREAISGGDITPSAVHVAPGGYHLLIERDHSFSLSLDARVRYVRPSADVLFESAAEAYGAGVIGVVLTGTNDDGARGLETIGIQGGLCLVQDPSEAEEAAMPAAALAKAAATSLPVAAIAARLMTEFNTFKAR
ncbi:chemotaxis protein CheB [Solimonas marina]|uniref:protein-glutamate methylesterase n=1 Tax=Solimonas marina TaxID=2714601 RepID=A0A970B8S5_9GAMM|nr:chemotaxis protein CheB [Solimonas marina]NKF22584.1 chemotaxis protein CheB [Solimonas marina]